MTPSHLLRKAFDVLVSAKLAIYLLVLIAAASIAGSLIPQGRNVTLASGAPEWVRRLNVHLQLNDIFHSWWYVLLLALLGFSLMAVTLKRLPTVLAQRGRGAGLVILLAHLGILLILGGMIYGGLSGFRYYTRIIEGEVTVLPSLPFAIELDRLKVDYYPEETFRHLGRNIRLPERQESALSLFNHGAPFLQTVAAPGHPVVARGVTLLPADKEIGWAFHLVVRDPGGREKVIPVHPWAPPLIRLGLSNNRILAHKVTPEAAQQRAEEPRIPTTAEIFLLEEGGTRRSLGSASETKPLQVDGFTISVWGVRPYTGLHVYRRPEKPFLLAGLVTLLVGLVGYVFGWGRRSFRQRNLGEERMSLIRAQPEVELATNGHSKGVDAGVVANVVHAQRE